MGERQSGQDSLFYGFSLEGHVPGDHMLRAIDKFADLGFVREHLKDYYSHTGRPSIDPELMIRMLLVGYLTHACSGDAFDNHQIDCEEKRDPSDRKPLALTHGLTAKKRNI